MGCQMNAHDSEKLIGIMDEIGASPAAENEADIVIYNTCCVRENAEQKVYGRLGYLKTFKKNRPNMKIALCGCMMQEDVVIEKLKKSYPEVDLIFGTYNIYKFPELLESLLDGSGRIIDIWRAQDEIVEDLPSIRKHSFKASVNIMYGCNNFCTYCIVPYVRGRERSREPENILAEVRALAESGVKEIQLLGQNVNSYGRGLKNEITFAQLLEMVNEVEGIERIRFISSHPKDLSQELIDAMGRLDKVCPQFHLPLQSGSDRLLKLMNRHYTKAQFLDEVRRLKEAVPDVSITTDIIVGFPGETREDFLETLNVVRQVRFDGAFTFIYSKREGTPAARMEQVDPEEAKANFDELLKLLEEIGRENNKHWVGKRLKVLAEEVSKNDATVLSGRTEHNHLVHFKADASLIGEMVWVTITDSTAFYLLGEMEKAEEV
ncbi:MAG: tRNA (N6-isopentenyl adenosine(37)-C2)-methylthiotransferase MiaB [Firmicutes bacterium]|nr:tRNA (N6-isopentenyl adenosine(37)-C2)-methylthiotransferase MiaB [Bacillota bacterium]